MLASFTRKHVLIKSLKLLYSWVYKEHTGLCGKPDHVAGMLFIGIQRLKANSFPKTVSQPTVSRPRLQGPFPGSPLKHEHQSSFILWKKASQIEGTLARVVGFFWPPDQPLLGHVSREAVKSHRQAKAKLQMHNMAKNHVLMFLGRSRQRSRTTFH